MQSTVRATSADQDRHPNDRRQRPAFLSLQVLGISGNRRASRRQSETALYVDQYHPFLGYSVLAIMVCSVLDAFITLRLLALGAVELNAAMAALIERSVHIFVASKLALTALSAMLLVIYGNVRVAGPLRCAHVVYAVTIFYFLLIVYELLLLRLLS